MHPENRAADLSAIMKRHTEHRSALGMRRQFLQTQTTRITTVALPARRPPASAGACTAEL